MGFRLLHLSDLHLGQRFHDQDRAADESHALGQIVQLCRTREVDVVVLAGDIFDTANPGAKETARYHGFLADLVLKVGVGTVVIIAGNHDSASRIEGPRELYEQCRIHTVGSLRLDEDPSKCLIPLRNRTGDEVGTCVALPYLRDGDVRLPTSGEAQIEAAQSHRDAVKQRMTQILAEVPRDKPFIVTGHAFCTEGVRDESERPVQVGNLGTLPASALAGEASYLALGHLHRPQSVGGREHWRYSGSLLPTGFDEIDIERSVVIADIPNIGPAQVEVHSLKPFRIYKSLKGSEREVLKAIDDLPETNGDEPPPWVRVMISDPTVEVGLAQHLTEQVRSKGWQLLGVHLPRRQVLQDKRPSGEAETPPEDILYSPDKTFKRLLDLSMVPEDSRPALIEAFVSLQERREELLGLDGGQK